MTSSMAWHRIHKAAHTAAVALSFLFIFAVIAFAQSEPAAPDAAVGSGQTATPAALVHASSLAEALHGGEPGGEALSASALAGQDGDADVGVGSLPSGPILALGDSVMLLVFSIWVKTITGSNALAGLTFLFMVIPALVAPLL